MKKLLITLILIAFWGCTMPTDSTTTEDLQTFTHDYWGDIAIINPSIDSLKSGEKWYEDSSFYHIWVNAFKDASTGDLSGDGIGDMVGIKEAIEEGYFEELGINAIWLSPFFEGKADNPNGNMHLYDTTDHYSVQSQFGDVDDVKALLKAAHDRDIRVLFDFVPNHVSNEHPWFTGSAAEDGIHDDWFNWRSSVPSSGWTGFDDNTDWYYNSARGEYFYGIFWDGMPDLNYNSPQVKKAMADILIYWLNIGFDGLRVDAVKYIFEDNSTQKDHSDTLEFFQEMRDLLDLYNSDGYSKMMIAENWTYDIGELNSYGGTESKPGFHMTLDFIGASDVVSLATNNSYAPSLGTFLGKSDDYSIIKRGAFLSNHDNVNSRPATYCANSLAKQKIAATYNTLSDRIPFLYYGNDIGMIGESGDDIELRQDFIWSEVSDSKQIGDNNSMLQWYRAIGKIRENYSYLFKESAIVENISSSNDVNAFSFTNSSETLLIVVNHGTASATISVDSGYVSLLGTDNKVAIGPLTARVYYKGSDALDHFFDDGTNVTYEVF